MSDLYCLKCKKYHHHNYYKCDILSLVPVTRRCRNLADTLYSFGIEPLSVGHFTQLVKGSDYKYIINVQIELRYPLDIIENLPLKWRVCTETCSDDHTPLAVPILAYYETYCYDGIKTVDERTQEVIDGFVQYLNDNYDADAVKAVTTFMYS